MLTSTGFAALFESRTIVQFLRGDDTRARDATRTASSLSRQRHTRDKLRGRDSIVTVVVVAAEISRYDDGSKR